jgi:hypothetical protein
VLQYHFNWRTISIAAGMTLWNFYFQIFDKAVGKEETVLFLAHLLRHLQRPLLIVWDRLPAHRSRLVGEFLDSLEGLIAIEYLPPYAPELNPVEYLWGLETPRTAQRMPKRLLGTKRPRPANSPTNTPPPSPYHRILETVFPCFPMNYIMRNSVRKPRRSILSSG